MFDALSPLKDNDKPIIDVFGREMLLTKNETRRKPLSKEAESAVIVHTGFVAFCKAMLIIRGSPMLQKNSFSRLTSPKFDSGDRGEDIANPRHSLKAFLVPRRGRALELVETSSIRRNET